ncbi:MAG: M20/M25/M40 family metallo-hydrolase [Chloroflexi bacterium]|nr:M20/M25/M40 family metallo-hydrolase [Chloroflexota bacterium]
MNELLSGLLDRVSRDRLRDLTMALVRIPSKTGDAVEVSEFYAEQVRALGLSVEILRDYPSSPSTVARYNQVAGGKTLTLDGHLDTIHADHVPPYIEGNRIYGRGAGDMKSGVAAMVEATRVLVESGVELGGNLVLFTHTLHEAPVGRMEALRDALARGDIFRDAALVAEGAFDTVHVAGKGQAIFDIEITREGETLHENVARPKGVPNPIDQAVRIAAAILDRDRALSNFRHPLLGSETFFLGQIHGGDFFNRLPTRAYINGIHRYWPDKDWNDVDRRLEQLINSVPCHPDLQVRWTRSGNGLGFDVGEDAEIVRALRKGYQQVVGRELPIGGSLSVSDVNVIAREGGIPVVAHGTGSTTAHADLEWVEIDHIVRSTKVFIATILNYLGVRH